MVWRRCLLQSQRDASRGLLAYPEHDQGRGGIQYTLDQNFHRPASVFHGVQAGRDDLGIVENQKVARAEKGGEGGEAEVFQAHTFCNACNGFGRQH